MALLRSVTGSCDKTSMRYFDVYNGLRELLGQIRINYGRAQAGGET